MKNLAIPACTCLCLLAITMTAPAAQAQDYRDYYLGFGIGLASADSDCDDDGFNCDGDDTAIKLYGGKRFHENLAFELAVQDFGKLTDDDFNVTRTADARGINLSLHGIIPLEEFGYFYGKVGMIAWEADYRSSALPGEKESDDGTDLTYGVGFAFTFGEKYDLRIEYERLNELGDEFTPGGAAIDSLNFTGSIYFE
ncbi:MAG: outer membrane beta-barrel protein [Gammaproteobacteria bacterium]|nr:outer membrane beta-barrel protein [Gammaproteobacteria bacterium]